MSSRAPGGADGADDGARRRTARMASRSSASASAPGARIRSACTSAKRATRSWATRSTVACAADCRRTLPPWDASPAVSARGPTGIPPSLDGAAASSFDAALPQDLADVLPFFDASRTGPASPRLIDELKDAMTRPYARTTRRENDLQRPDLPHRAGRRRAARRPNGNDGSRAASRIGRADSAAVAGPRHPDPTVPVRHWTVDLGIAGRLARAGRGASPRGAAGVPGGNRLATRRDAALGTYYPSPGFCDERMIFYSCTGLVAAATPASSRPRRADRATNVHDPAGLEARRRAGEIIDMKTIVGLSLLSAVRPGGRAATPAVWRNI